MLFAISLMVIALSGCTTTRHSPDSPAPTATYIGPSYLRGTVGSMTSLRNARPLLVSGYGLVVGLHGTGSTVVPGFLRQAMINRMQQYGLGSAQYGTQQMTPQKVLADKNTAVVAVRGLIPPGAVKGTRFDIILSALSGTQTTSLAYGTLWSTDLTVGGVDPSLPYMPTKAIAQGEVYTKPFEEKPGTDASDSAADNNFRYNAVILSGATVQETRKLVLTLNQPSWIVSRQISDQINERFPMQPGTMEQTADAKNDLFIQINIPDRYADDPAQLITLIRHLFVRNGQRFGKIKTQSLMASLIKHPQRADDVMLCCVGFGKSIIPILRNYYNSSNMTIRMTALQAGAHLQDERSSKYLYKIAQNNNTQLRIKAAKALVHLPRSLRGSRTLQMLLDDSNTQVRLAAYQSLSEINDPTIDRVLVQDINGNTKYIIDRVPAQKPFIYITQKDIPRIVIFDKDLGFQTPMLQTLWHHRLMLRQNGKKDPLTLFYQWPVNRLPLNISSDDAQKLLNGKTYHLQPTVATLAYMLGHNPTVESPDDGLNLSYSQVVDVLYQLCKRKAINAPIRIHISALVRFIAQSQQRVKGRPLTSNPDGGPSIGGKFQVPIAGSSLTGQHTTSHSGVLVPGGDQVHMQTIPSDSQ